MSKLQQDGIQSALNDQGRSALSKYRALVVGSEGRWSFVKYEIITSLFGSWPGALGLWLRQKFYPCLFRECRGKIFIGRDVTIRHPGRITLGKHVVIGDQCVLDAKGTEGDGIVIGDGVFISRGTTITLADGTIEIEEGANLGSFCRVGTHGHTRIGKKALISSYCYLVGADHKTDRTDIPIMDQPNYTHGGVTLGDGCWLGARVTVMDGVTVGHDSIIGAHAVVTEDVAPFSVAVGIPAKVIRSRK